MEELFNIKNVLLIGLMTGVVGNFKQIVAWLWRVLSVRLFTMVEVNNGTATYEYLLRWLYDNHHKKFSSFVTLKKTGYGFGGESFLGLGFGEFVFLHNKMPIWVTHSKTNLTGGSNELLAIQTLSIKSFKRAKPLLLGLIEAARKIYKFDGIPIHIQNYSNWNFSGTKQDRSFDNVVLPSKDEESLRSSLDAFVSGKEKYRRLGIPYRMGILLHGIQGSGKTSTVYAIASYLGYPIYYLSLNSGEDASIVTLVGSIPKKSILLIEDIHDQIANIKSEKSTLNIATLLNLFDGVSSPEGIITIITTNDRTALDPRLLRPGRINLTIEYSAATMEQKEKLFALFGKRVEAHEGKTIAQLQQELLSHSSTEITLLEDDGREAVEEANKILEEFDTLKK